MLSLSSPSFAVLSYIACGWVCNFMCYVCVGYFYPRVPEDANYNVSKTHCALDLVFAVSVSWLIACNMFLAWLAKRDDRILGEERCMRRLCLAFLYEPLYAVGALRSSPLVSTLGSAFYSSSEFLQGASSFVVAMRSLLLLTWLVILVLFTVSMFSGPMQDPVASARLQILRQVTALWRFDYGQLRRLPGLSSLLLTLAYESYLAILTVCLPNSGFRPFAVADVESKDLAAWSLTPSIDFCCLMLHALYFVEEAPSILNGNGIASKPDTTSRDSILLRLAGLISFKNLSVIALKLTSDTSLTLQLIFVTVPGVAVTFAVALLANVARYSKQEQDVRDALLGA